MQPSAAKTVGFVAGVAVVASILVATSAVTLRERQEFNALLDLRKKVLDVAGLMPARPVLTDLEISERFERHIIPVVVNLATGIPDDTIDPQSFDQRAATVDPATSRPAPANAARITRLPIHAQVFHVVEDNALTAIILPIVGSGLWSTMYGFIALSPDLMTVTGLTFYEHGETAGLGGEIDNPRWQGLWQGRQAFDDAWTPQISVIKGAAAPAEEDPFSVDGLAGATITGRGVTDTIHFWLGPDGFGPYLAFYRQEAGIS
jgi:Na+-transporting NADH:ubiquinone oxidoreductase subunit C